MRKGRYAIWNGCEYPIVSHRRTYYLQSDNPADRENGFVSSMNRDQLYFREVRIEELSDAYEVFPYVMLEGHRFAVEHYDEKRNLITLTTYNPFVLDKVDAVMNGRDGWKVEVPLRDVTVIEDRLPILGFDE